jgi:membrane protease YdiL (CAAX protease family)
MGMNLREKLKQIDDRTLFLNLFITQAALVLLGMIIYFLFLRQTFTLAEIYHVQDMAAAVMIGAICAGILIILNLVLFKLLPEGYFDDGGVNERLFRRLNVLQIAGLALFIAVIEEFFFRAVLQNTIGLFWASIIFAAIHYRYFGRFFYGLLIVGVSFGFGLLYHVTESLWSVMTAHFLVDFIFGLFIRFGWVRYKKNEN